MSTINRLRQKVSDLRKQVKTKDTHLPVLLLDKEMYEHIKDQLDQQPDSEGGKKIKFPSGETVSINQKTVIFVDDIQTLE